MQISWSKGKKRPEISGKNSHWWKGGKTINTQGYILIKKREHPFADKRGYVLKSRLIMEKHLGRYLKPSEIVHHIDGDKLNNSIENLVLFATKNIHTKFHRLKNPNSNSNISSRTF